MFNNGVVELSGLGSSEPRFGINSLSPNPGISFNPRDYNYVVVRMRAETNTGGTQGIFFFGSPDIGGTFVSRPYAIGTSFEDYVFDFSTTTAWLSESAIRNFALGLPNNGPKIYIDSFRICNKENLPVYTPVRIVGELFGPEVVGTGDDYQYNLVIRNTGATATTGTTTIKIFFDPTSGISYRTTAVSGWTYSYSSGVLTITTTNVLNPGFSITLPILVTGSTVGTYEISGRVWTDGDPVASTELTARETNTLQTIVANDPPCIGLSNLTITGESVVNQGSTNNFSVNYSGSTRGISFTWSIVSGTGATIVSGQSTGAASISFNFATTSSQVVIRCTITNLCSTQSIDLTVSPRLFGNTTQSKVYTSQSCSPTQIPGTWVLTVQADTYFGFNVNIANGLAIDWLNSSTAQTQAENEMISAGRQCFASCSAITGVTATMYQNGAALSDFNNIVAGVVYEIRAFVSGGSNVTYNWFFTHGTPVNQVGNSVFVIFDFNDRQVPSDGGASYSAANFSIVVNNSCDSSSATAGATVNPFLYSASDTRTSIRNNCPSRQSPVGSVTDTVTYFAVTQARANEGVSVLVNNRQALANSQLSCQTVSVGNDPAIFVFVRDNCPAGSSPVGSLTITVGPNTYFGATKTEANDLAAAMTIPAGQAQANAELSCLTLQVTGLTWTTSNSVSGVPGCSNASWNISPNNRSLRYDIADSFNCGGSCDAIQVGVATANITVGASPTNLSISFSGIGEREQNTFENIEFRLNGVVVARAFSPGGGLGCQMGPVVPVIDVPGPYFLPALSSHVLQVTVNTNDALFHVGSYYQIDLAFS